MGPFLSVILRDRVLCHADSLRENSAFGHHTIDAHIALLASLRRDDRAAMRHVMERHMHCAECLMQDLDATLDLDLLRRQ